MDGNGGRRLKAYWRRHKHVESYRRTVSKFLNTHKQALLTSALLIAIVFLLFGIFSQFQAPASNTPPNGVTLVSYSTFVEQVKAGNVIAVTIQGNDINGLLTKPLSRNAPVTVTSVASSPNKNAADFTAWSRYVGGGYVSWSNTTSSPPIDPARAIYTHALGSGDAGFMQMLLSNHIIVNTLPVAQPSMWLA